MNISLVGCPGVVTPLAWGINKGFPALLPLTSQNYLPCFLPLHHNCRRRKPPTTSRHYLPDFLPSSISRHYLRSFLPLAFRHNLPSFLLHHDITCWTFFLFHHSHYLRHSLLFKLARWLHLHHQHALPWRIRRS